MRRLLFVLLVGLLCTTTSGVVELIVPERCALEDAASPVEDGTCAPTCLRCHCARPFDIVVPLRLAEVALEPIEWIEPLSKVALPAPGDILHVPRPAHA